MTVVFDEVTATVDAEGSNGARNEARAEQIDPARPNDERELRWAIEHLERREARLRAS